MICFFFQEDEYVGKKRIDIVIVYALKESEDKKRVREQYERCGLVVFHKKEFTFYTQK